MAEYNYVGDGSPDGTIVVQAATEKLAFYGGTPVIQATSATDAVTALINLGLLASGTYTITGQALVSSNETGTTLSSVTPLAATGWSKINSTANYTYFMSSPIKGTEKFIYVDGINTSGVTASISLNRTTVITNSSQNYLITPGSTLATSASSLATIVITQTSIAGAGITLIAASSVEWVLKSNTSTLITYTT